MALTIIGFLIGAALSVHFNVFILFPAIGFVAFALQIGFLVGAVVASIRAPNADAPRTFAYAGGKSRKVLARRYR
jgi:hypothetical protein